MALDEEGIGAVEVSSVDENSVAVSSFAAGAALTANVTPSAVVLPSVVWDTVTASIDADHRVLLGYGPSSMPGPFESSFGFLLESEDSAQVLGLCVSEAALQFSMVQDATGMSSRELADLFVDGSGEEVAEVLAVLKPPDQTSWAELDPDERSLIAGETPPEILGLHRQVSVSFLVPTRWTESPLALCTRTSFGWNVCSALDNEGVYNADGTITLTGYYEIGQPLEVILVDPAEVFGLIGVVGQVDIEGGGELASASVKVEASLAELPPEAAIAVADVATSLTATISDGYAGPSAFNVLDAAIASDTISGVADPDDLSRFGALLRNAGEVEDSDAACYLLGLADTRSSSLAGPAEIDGRALGLVNSAVLGQLEVLNCTGVDLSPGELLDALVAVQSVEEANGNQTVHFADLLVSAARKEEQGRLDQACAKLVEAIDRSDGVEPPTDFVQGDGLDPVVERIRVDMTRLEC